MRSGRLAPAADHAPEDETEDQDRYQPAEAAAVGVAGMAEHFAEHVADDGHRDDAGDDDGRRRYAARAAHSAGVYRRGRHARPRLTLRQVGEQLAELAPGAGLQRPSGPVFELLLREPPGLEVLAQLGGRAITVGVRRPEVTAREAPDRRVH